MLQQLFSLRLSPKLIASSITSLTPAPVFEEHSALFKVN